MLENLTNDVVTEIGIKIFQHVQLITTSSGIPCLMYGLPKYFDQDSMIKEDGKSFSTIGFLLILTSAFIYFGALRANVEPLRYGPIDHNLAIVGGIVVGVLMPFAKSAYERYSVNSEDN